MPAPPTIEPYTGCRGRILQILFFSVLQADQWVLFIRINPYTKETGPPLTRPEPMVLQTVSHVAMRETARERVERVLKFWLT